MAREKTALLLFTFLSCIALSFVWNHVQSAVPVHFYDKIFLDDDQIRDDLPMELSFEEEAVLWTVTNQSGLTLNHGSGDHAKLQYAADQTWHTIAITQIGDKYFIVTMVAHTLLPGQQYSSGYNLHYLNDYHKLSDGIYRLIFPMDSFHKTDGTWKLYGYAACEFQIINGVPQAA